MELHTLPLSARQLQLIVVGVLLLLSAGLASYLVAPEVKAYRKNMTENVALQRAVNDSAGLPVQLDEVRGRVAALGQKMHGDMANLPLKQMEAFVIGRLQTISWRHRVELVGIVPSKGDSVDTFREILFEVELVAGYFDIHGWLSDLGEELGFVVIKRFEIVPQKLGGDDPVLNARLTLATYRGEKG